MFSFDPTIANSVNLACWVGGDMERRIFSEPWIPLKHEEIGLAKFVIFLKKNKLIIPEEYCDEERAILRYLQEREYDPKWFSAVYEDILDHAQWKNRPIPDSLLEAGIFYVNKRDKYYHPILIINAERVFTTFASVPPERLFDLACFIYNFSVKELLMPGRVEQWSIIVDLKRIGQNFQTKADSFMNSLKKYFKGRLYKWYIVNANWFTRASLHFTYRLG